MPASTGPNDPDFGTKPGADAPDVSDLVVEFLTRTENDPESQSVVLDELCEQWPSRSSALRSAVGNLDAAGWIDIQSLPEQIGEFKPTRRLGGGGMGVVLLAEQPGLDRQVAIKLLRTDELLRDGARARFQRETEAVARLAHPNIVAVHSVGVDDGIPFLVMDYVEGASLDRVIAAQKGCDPSTLSGSDVQTSISADLAGAGVNIAPGETNIFEGSWIEVALRVTRDVAAALAHAHAKGVLHRDVKPSNVMLTADGRVQLVDFGLATMLDSDRLTRSGSLVGSLPYMAPEELDSGPESTPRSDVYSLGITLYELLILDLPFPGRGTRRLRKDIEEGRFIRARTVNSAINADLEAVLTKACSREPEDRYASASAFAADLTALLEKRPVSARLPGTFRRLKSWARRRPEQAALTAALGLVFVGGPLAYALVRKGHADEMEVIIDQLKVALTDEESARTLAERHFGRAIGALDRVTSHMAQDGLVDEPRMQRVRLDIINDALEIIGDLKDEQPDHPSVLDIWARFHAARGSVLLDLGEIDEGLAALRRNLAARRQIAANRPDLPRLADDIWPAQLSVAAGLSYHGRGSEAVDLYREANERIAARVRAVPSDTSAIDSLGEGRSSLALALFGRERFQESEDVVREALPLALSAAHERPNEDLPHVVLSKLNLTLGNALTRKGNHAEAEAAYGKAAEALRVSLSLKPGRRAYQSRLSEAEQRRAEALTRLRRTDEAIRCLTAAIQVNNDLRRQFPSVLQFEKRNVALLNVASFAESKAENYVRAVELGEQALAASLEIHRAHGGDFSKIEGLNLAVSMANLSGRICDCEELGPDRFERTIAHTLEALKLIELHDPQLKMARGVAQIAHFNRVIAEARLDNLAGAKTAIADLLEVTSEAPSDLRHLGEAWAEVRCSQVRKDAPKGEQDQAYQASLDALERAVGAGYRDHVSLVEAVALDPMRQDPRFIELLEQLNPKD